MAKETRAGFQSQSRGSDGKLVIPHFRCNPRGIYPRNKGESEINQRVDIMSKAHPPKLKKFMDKKLSLKLNSGRHVQRILRGLDPFMNLVIDECVEMATSGQQNNIGMVVIRGNSIIMLEALERV